MTDNLTKEKRSKIMRSIKSKDTKPELFVRKILTSLGYRYRLHTKNLPGKPDIVFLGKKKAIFVHGCFWHGHLNCKIAKIPAYSHWQEKLSKNRLRDQKACDDLNNSGWKSLVIWECELKDPKGVENLLIEFLDNIHT